MTRYSQQRRRAISLRMSRLGQLSQAVQRAKRLAAVDPEALADMLANPMPAAGETIGSIELRGFRSGAVARWTILRGPRRNNYARRTPDGRTSRPHGLAWILNCLRRVLLRRVLIFCLIFCLLYSPLLSIS